MDMTAANQTDARILAAPGLNLFFSFEPDLVHPDTSHQDRRVVQEQRNGLYPRTIGQ
jgi:hypothetical protein